jgi:glyoxylase-like metal-dependent hydrolase (beta-lactamase superfamily II)
MKPWGKYCPKPALNVSRTLVDRRRRRAGVIRRRVPCRNGEVREGGKQMLEAGPDDSDVYHIYALRFGRVPERTVHLNFMRNDLHDGPMPMDFNIWIVRNAHRTMLVDTGFGPRAAAERARPLDIDPMQALAQIGIAPDSVTDILLSHLHFDHAGNLDRLPRACVHVQDKEVAFATGRCMCHRALRLPFDAEDVVTLVRRTYDDKVRHHDGASSPFPGITLHPLPGHSRGLQGVRVMTPRGPVLLASDASHFYANMLRKAPFSVTVDAADTLDSYDEMMRLVPGVEHIIPGHDPRVRDLYPAAIVDGIELTLLHAPPKPHDLEALATP